VEHRYVVIGAGAIGGAIGARLHQAGREVVLVARGEHLRVLQDTGLRLRTASEDVRLRVPAVGGPDEVRLTTRDVLVLATKTQQAGEALRTWADVPVHGTDAGPAEEMLGTAGERLPLLTALNGVASERMALRYFRSVVGVCVWMPAVHLVPGEVVLRAAPRSGVLHLGSVPVGAVPDPVLGEVAADLDAAGFDAPLPRDVMPWKYRKLISNLGNVFQALVAGNGDWRGLEQLAVAEARQVLDAAGIAVTPDEEEAAVRAAGFSMHPVPGVPDDVGGSTWQSLRRGTGNVETDYLNGEIVRVAHGVGQAAPLNATLASLARRAAQTGHAPGSISADQLAAELEVTP
jgi:2-dehydropantoate 2-reductase